MDRDAIVSAWFELTRKTLPDQAAARGWPVRFDHCFQRILLDNALGGAWRERIAAPAFRHADAATLQCAIALGEAVRDGTLDLTVLNRKSLRWRGKIGPTQAAP